MANKTQAQIAADKRHRALSLPNKFSHTPNNFSRVVIEPPLNLKFMDWKDGKRK